MNYQSINKIHVQELIKDAKSKIEKYKIKIENIDAKIEKLNEDRECVEALVEYIEFSSTRKNLLIDLCITKGEYGMPEDTPDEIINYYKDRCTNRGHQIDWYTNQKKKRQEGIAFMERDIGLLNKVIRINDRPIGLDFGLMDC